MRRAGVCGTDLHLLGDPPVVPSGSVLGHELAGEVAGLGPGVAGWQVENLVTRIDELYFETGLPLDQAIPALMEAVETASAELQSEASLPFLPPYLAQHVGSWRAVGYRPQTIQGLGVRAWQEAAVESMPRGSSLWFKRLRDDRVLRPV